MDTDKEMLLSVFICGQFVFLAAIDAFATGAFAAAAVERTVEVIEASLKRPLPD
jgi:hypothetical protein